MASTNKTANYDLSQYIGTDKPTYLGDYNSDMRKIDTALKNNADGVTDVENIVGGLNTRTTNLETEMDAQETKVTELENAVNGLLPVGSVVSFAGSTIPEKWLICDGSAISRTEYNDLFNTLGVVYGVGDGATTFNIPNLLGKIPVGYNGTDTDFDSLGKIGGEKVHTLTTDELPSHSHVGLYLDGAETLLNNGSIPTTPLVAGQYGTGGTTFISGPTGNNQPHNNLQPYIVMKYIIKAKI